MSEAIKQAVIDGWIMVGLGVPVLWAVRKPMREGRKAMMDEDRPPEARAGDALALIVLLLVALLACGVSVHGVRHLLNPGYFAGGAP